MRDNNGTGRYKPMYFYRKAYDKLLDWKRNYADKYAVLLEGARRVGKSTIAERFAQEEYKTYIRVDFSNVNQNLLSCFDDIADMDMFFLRIQAETGISLHPHESVIIFDEIQLFPKARQAIKHFVRDGRYHYIETGSLVSIRKNVKDILIPSEEMKIQIYPMDYEEFCKAVGFNYDLIRSAYIMNRELGQSVNRKWMRELRIYIAVGGMPQAVEAYVNGANFVTIDRVKRMIIQLYEEDFKKIDTTGRLSAMYHSIPAQLAKDKKKYRITATIQGKKTKKTEGLLFELLDSKTILICYNTMELGNGLASSKDFDSYKLYLADTGLFVSLMFMDRPEAENEIYAKLLSDKFPANLGYLYENLTAQIIASSGRELYYHTWEKTGSTHYYEVDFLITEKGKINAFEIKSSGLGAHESIKSFAQKYEQSIKNTYLISQKDVSKEQNLLKKPFYMLPFLLDPLVEK